MVMHGWAYGLAFGLYIASLWVKLMVKHMEYGLANGVLCFSTIKYVNKPIHTHG